MLVPLVILPKSLDAVER